MAFQCFSFNCGFSPPVRLGLLDFSVSSSHPPPLLLLLLLPSSSSPSSTSSPSSSSQLSSALSSPHHHPHHRLLQPRTTTHTLATTGAASVFQMRLFSFGFYSKSQQTCLPYTRPKNFIGKTNGFCTLPIYIRKSS